MKLITLILFLFLIISINSGSLLDVYFIDGFKDFLEKNGLFEIIEAIKVVYGQDVAIISCEEITENNKGNCKKLVTEYMIPSPSPTLHKNFLSSEGNKPYMSPLNITNITVGNNVPAPPKSSKRYSKIDQIMKRSGQMFDIKIKLRQKFNKTKSELIYNKIIKRVKKFHFL